MRSVNGTKAHREQAGGWLGSAVGLRLVVHTADDRSIEGTLGAATSDGVLLQAAKLLGKPVVSLGGEVFIPHARLLFVQTVPE